MTQSYALICDDDVFLKEHFNGRPSWAVTCTNLQKENRAGWPGLFVELDAVTSQHGATDRGRFFWLG